jgi:hypothetical protein
MHSIVVTHLRSPGWIIVARPTEAAVTTFEDPKLAISIPSLAAAGPFSALAFLGTRAFLERSNYNM